MCLISREGATPSSEVLSEEASSLQERQVERCGAGWIEEDRSGRVHV
jgi:hypothetical protein